eukprot:sb/3463559/
MSLVVLTEEVSRIPLSYIETLVECELEFPKSIRSVYPGYQLVTGENFIAQYNTTSCSIPTKQLYGDQGCENDCTEAAGLLMDVNQTLHYCYTESSKPVPYSASLHGNTYVFSNETDPTMSYQCLHDPTKSAHWTYQEGVYYIATDGYDGYSTYDTTTGKYKTLESIDELYIEQVLGIYATPTFIYTLYSTTSKTTRITRYCVTDITSSKNIRSLAYANLYCTVTIGGVDIKLDQVLGVERIGDKLYMLVTSAPVTSALVYLCEMDLNDMGDVFDGSYYWYYDYDGKLSKTDDPITLDCTVEQAYNILKSCVNEATSDVIVTSLPSPTTHSFVVSFTENLTFFLSGLDPPLTPCIPLLQMARSTSNPITDWLLVKEQDENSNSPISQCEKSRRPTTTDRCVQELTEGSFSVAFPDGYSYVEEGTVCVQETVFVDRVITIYPNASKTEENRYRVLALFPPFSDCSIATEAPVIDPSDKMSGRELGLLAGLLIFAVAFLALLLFTCHSSTRIVEKLRTGPCSPVPPKLGGPPQHPHPIGEPPYNSTQCLTNTPCIFRSA